ncbi:MAG: DUF4160 domain-containing protein [Chloroflexi bacterium]|nr:DUF4160 domain-containing protein [Chloroflexota bacterium]
MSPTVFKKGSYRFFFWSNEPDRPHIHCQRDNAIAKFWLEKNGKPEIEFVSKESGGFSQKELKDIRHIIEENLYFLIKEWCDHFQMAYPSYLTK